jgi:hypothetical protein
MIAAFCTTLFGTTFLNAQSSDLENWIASEPGTVTLYSRANNENKNDGYGKSAFSFRYGLRSDAGSGMTRNNYEIEYGGMNINGDSNWFRVTLVTDDCSRIRDLGEMRWADIFEVPDLPASLEPQNGIALSFKSKNFEESSNGQVSKVALGHMYVLHTKDSFTDFYTLFRVDKIIPNNDVTVSWKNVPSPRKDHVSEH